jgi:hypothetical protein
MAFISHKLVQILFVTPATWQQQKQRTSKQLLQGFHNCRMTETDQSTECENATDSVPDTLGVGQLADGVALLHLKEF